MIRYDAGAAVLGTDDPAALAAAEGDPTGKVCQAAIKKQESTHFFWVITTSLVVILCTATVLLLVYGLYRISKDANVTSLVTAAGGLVTGAASLFVIKEMREMKKNNDDAIEQIAKWCGTST